MYFIGVAVVSLMVVLTVCAPGCAGKRADRQSPGDAERTCVHWAQRLSRHSFAGGPESLLRRELGDSVQEYGRIAWGGTGSQTVYFHLGQLVIISVDTDVSSRIVGEPRVWRARSWPKSCGESLECAPEAVP